MVKRVVVRAAGAARGYVDGRFIGEEKDGEGRGRKRRGAGSAVADSVLGAAGIAGPGARKKGRGKTAGQGQGQGQGGQGRGQGQGRGKGQGQSQGQGKGAGQGKAAQGQGNRRGQSQSAGQGVGQGQRRGKGQGGAQGTGQGRGRAPAEGNFIAGDVGNAVGNTAGGGTGNARRGRGGRSGRGGVSGGTGSAPGLGTPFGAAPFEGGFGGNAAGAPRGKPRKNRTGKKTPFRAPVADSLRQQTHSPTQAADIRRSGDESKSGQFAEALAASANVKRERLHKVMAQSGIGSRRDMEIMIGSGRVMVNGIVATAGTQVAPGDNVLVDHRPIKLKFTQDLPRILLYHKPEGEIVTTNDPGNRITVFDNLPRVENGKWIAVGRLDINTSGLLIFTTGGELANRFMHPRYEVEREYAVRILGELTDEQTQNLLSGVDIGDGKAADDEDDADLAGDLDDNEFDHAKFEDEAPFVPPVDEHDDEFEAPKDEDAQPVEETDELIVNHPLPHAAPLPHDLRNGLARFDVIEKRGGEGVNHWYHVVIREGRNREVRKMFESQGLTVSRLIRTRFGKIELPPRLLRGKLMELTPDQVRSVLVSAGMVVDGPTGKLPTHEDRSARARGPREQREPREARDGRGAGRERTNARGGQRVPRTEGVADGLPVDANRPPREPRDGRARRGKGRGPGQPFDAASGLDVANADQMASGLPDGNANPNAGPNTVADGDPARSKRRRSRGPRRDSRPPREGVATANVGLEAGGENAGVPVEGNAQGPREPGQERRTNPRGRRNFRGRNRRGGGRNGGESSGGEGGGEGGNGGPSGGGGGEPNGNV
jgi:23S rRNA pseudouridine2605 synthase